MLGTKTKTIRKSSSDQVFDVVNVIAMVILFFIFAWPLWFTVIASFSDPKEGWLGNVFLLPKGFTLMAYKETIKYKAIWIGYRNTILLNILSRAFVQFKQKGSRARQKSPCSLSFPTTNSVPRSACLHRTNRPFISLPAREIRKRP